MHKLGAREKKIKRLKTSETLLQFNAAAAAATIAEDVWLYILVLGYLAVNVLVLFAIYIFSTKMHVYINDIKLTNKIITVVAN